MGGVMVSNQYRTEEITKEQLIHQLLLLGVFKKGELHLFELTISELEEEFAKLTSY
jgi:hypothetical protein